MQFLRMSTAAMFDAQVEISEIIVGRLSRARAPLDRVHFVPALPHHMLMALYKLSEVVLDSWMAGDDVSVLRQSLRCFHPRWMHDNKRGAGSGRLRGS